MTFNFTKIRKVVICFGFIFSLSVSELVLAQEKKVPLHESDLDFSLLGGLNFISPVGAALQVGGSYRIHPRWGTGLQFSFQNRVPSTTMILATGSYYFNNENEGFIASLGIGLAMRSPIGIGYGAQLEYNHPLTTFLDKNITAVANVGYFGASGTPSQNFVNGMLGLRYWL